MREYPLPLPFCPPREEAPLLPVEVLANRETLDRFDLDHRRCATRGHQAMVLDLAGMKADEALLLALAFPHPRERAQEPALNPPRELLAPVAALLAAAAAGEPLLAHWTPNFMGG
jgi:hypothetical protein